MEKTFTEETKEILRRIFNGQYRDDEDESQIKIINKATSDIKELIKKRVPKEIDRWDGKLQPNERGFNNCREEILKALEE